MQYNLGTQAAIVQMSIKGYSGRKIAKELGLSKSGVNDFLNRVNMSGFTEEIKRTKQGPKVLFFDLETSAALVYAFGRHKQYINQDAVVQEGGKILMAGYKWLGDDTVKTLYDKSEIRQQSDYLICAELWELFEQADVVVAHNARNFDLKVLETRCLANDLPPLPTVQVIDTLDIAKKKLRLPSNKLDSIGAYFGLGRKVSHEGIGLWVKVQQGDEQALENMLEYCQQDVELLAEVFLQLQSRGLVSQFNAALYYDDNKTRCKHCGSDDLDFTGRTVTTATGVFEEIRCNSCQAVQRGRFNLLSKEKRKNLLAAK